MKLHAEKPTANAITAITENALYIDGIAFNDSVFVGYDTPAQAWGARCLEDITADLLSTLITFQPELVLIGTGKTHGFVHPQHSRVLLERGIGLECMSTQAAARTYNVLLQEGRRVFAALIL